jgi:hypothetical protein
MNIKKCQSLIDSLLSKFGTINSHENPYPNKKDMTKKKMGEMLFKTHLLEGADKQQRVDFGIINVPENRSKSDSRSIQLPFIKLYSNAKMPSKPIFWPGGGLRTNNHFKTELRLLLKETLWMLNHHDVIIVGYRGLDLFFSINGVSIPEMLKIENNPICCEDLKKMGDLFFKSYKTLQKRGIDFEGYNIVEIVDDIENLRSALGLQKINLFASNNCLSVCYIYGLKYPEWINHTLMGHPGSSVNFIFKPEMFDIQLKYYSYLNKKDRNYI